MAKKAEYYLFKKQKSNGEFIWYARFVDENTGKPFATRSTGVLVKGKKGEGKNKAHEAAKDILTNMQRGKQKIAMQLFTSYVQEFWSEGSAYIHEKANVEKRPLSVMYVMNNRNAIKNHLVPFLPIKGLAVKDVTAGIIRDWRTWAAEKGMSGRQINTTMQAMSVAVKYAEDRGELDNNPFAKIKKAPETPKEKGVLTAEEKHKLLLLATPDPREKLAVLLGIQCGMRRGEIRGLQWGDIDTEKREISIVHNYQDLEGVKAPKAGSTRIVPLVDTVENTLEAVRGVHMNPTDTAFVFESINTPGRPHCPEYFVNALRHCLDKIGITEEEQKQRNITLHSLRHSFVTLGRLSGLNDFEIQTLAGHKSSAMMDHYSHGKDTLDMDKIRKRIEKPVDMDVA